MSYLGNIVSSVQTVFEGLTITFSHLFREPMTIQYPDRTPIPVKDTLPLRYRGFLDVQTDICTGCTLCQKACPIDCILIEAGKDPELGQRVMTRFAVDLSKCMYCGLCTEPCPTGAIRFTREFEAATYDVKTLVREYILNGEKIVPYKAPKK
ncbi:MAG: 4Fe-4S binding protein [bacterium]|nr:4Fe-4S binding protein [bacterium]MBU1917356.1 4Fe-4S binding protein [bacterium]